MASESSLPFENPFRPGAGHMPPYLAGREHEEDEFRALLRQKVILNNLILTGLRGVGKTVLLNRLKPIALQDGWLWAGTDLSESASVNETTFATRILTDVSIVTSSITLTRQKQLRLGFLPAIENEISHMNFSHLSRVFDQTPGLVSDKLKSVLAYVWEHVAQLGAHGFVFAYDEAQNLSDHAQKEQYPLSVLLDVFQSVQKKQIPFMLILTGLPTLMSKLVESRTYSERMFHIVELQRLTESASREAIVKPIEDANCPVKFTPQAVDMICGHSGGYPYFIQFLCKEAYDAYLIKRAEGQKPQVPIQAILEKLDADFFAGRWDRATDRQKDLLRVISLLENCDSEFISQIVIESKTSLDKGFKPSHVNQMLSSLSGAGLIYKNRHGRYMFAVPLLHEFIRRQFNEDERMPY